jgi:hypothetical protein
LACDIDSESLQVIHRGAGLYYGIAVQGGHYCVAARRRMVSSTQAAADERGAILVFDQDLKLVQTIEAPFPLRDLHQIAWIGDELWCTCSYENMIGIMRADGSWERWYPLGPSADEPYDKNHFNSITDAGPNVAILAHNLQNPSEFFLFDKQNRNLVDRITLGKQAHNLWRADGCWRTCSSGEGLLVGEDGFRIDTGGFPRGLARAGDLWCVGISELAERKDRDMTSGEIQVFTPDWVLSKKIALEGEGLVLDFQVLS